MTIPIGGVWRPGESDLEDEPDAFFGRPKPKPKPTPDPEPSDNESNLPQLLRSEIPERVQLGHSWLWLNAVVPRSNPMVFTLKKYGAVMFP